MNDGNTAFFPGGAGGKSWDVARALSELYADPAFPRLIVVAVHPLLRQREYTHAEWAPSRPSSGVEEYTSYMADCVKAFIDAAYRTRSGSESTVIAGSSHGGLASFYMATRRPDRFGAAVCMSPSFWAGVDPVHGGDYAGGPLSSSSLVDPVKETLANPAVRPRVWIDWGLVRTGGDHNEKIEAAACRRGREMVELFQGSFGYEVGRELLVAEDPEGEHDEVAWGRRLPSALRALFGSGER
jgi:pimeloyl-ACP methyl ester carboxylesterase